MSPVLVIAGPTAVGKSRLALDVAESVGAEIISADSRQVYQDLDIGTAKPRAEELRRVSHHLINLVEPTDSYSVGRFREDFNIAISGIQERRRPTAVTGGSTLYVEVLVRGLADLPPLPEALRAALTQEAGSAAGRAHLYAELEAGDPAAADTLDPSKSQRLARLVGVLRHTGRRPSDLWREEHVPPVPHILVVLDRPRTELYARINQRVDQMIAEGLVDEVRQLYARGEQVRTLLRATIGYREIVGAIEEKYDLDEAIRLIKRNTRRYAKRQLTWYRRYDDALWVDARTATAASVLDVVAPWPSR